MAVFPTGPEETFYQEHPKEAGEIRRKYMGGQGDVSGRTDGYMFCTAGRLEEEKNPQFPVERNPETERKNGRNIF